MKALNLKIAVLFSAILFASALLTGCNKSDTVTGTGSTTDNLTVSAMADDNATDNGTSDVLVITEAKALINEVEFETEPSTTTQHVHIAPFVVNFNVTGGLTTIVTGQLPTGNFSKVKFKIHKPEDNETPSDPEFKIGNSGNERFSFIVKGTFNGTPFVYRSRKTMDLAVNLNSTLSIDANSANVTVVFNKSLWFKNGSIVLDPSSGDDTQIDDNIRGSFKHAFRDDDHNGSDDHQ